MEQKLQTTRERGIKVLQQTAESESDPHDKHLRSPGCDLSSPGICVVSWPSISNNPLSPGLQRFAETITVLLLAG